MAVIGKFYVAAVKQFSASKDQIQIELQAVTRGNANSEWAKASPYGKIELSITNPAASAQFVDALGEEFYVRFERVPAADLDPLQHEFVESDKPEGTYGHGLCNQCGQSPSEHLTAE